DACAGRRWRTSGRQPAGEARDRGLDALASPAPIDPDRPGDAGASAVRSALSTPAGGSLVAALPTGEGKSMILQLIQRLEIIGSGFARLEHRHRNVGHAVLDVGRNLAVPVDQRGLRQVVRKRWPGSRTSPCPAGPARPKTAAARPLTSSTRLVAASGIGAGS